MMEDYLARNNLTVSDIVHMAAYTSPPKAETNPMKALDVNVVGTAHIVKLCHNLNCRLIYISTDYVFDGRKKGGLYTETDGVNPRNRYAISKLGGECTARMHSNSVIIRLSFGPDEFPYPGAFTDQWTSREKVSDVAYKIAQVVESDFTGIIHIGADRRTVREYAISISPNQEIKKLSIKDMKTDMPEDTSLDTSRYKSIFGGDE